MKYLFPVFALGASAFAILWTPWPTAKQMFNPHTPETLQETIEWLDPLRRANYAKYQ